MGPGQCYATSMSVPAVEQVISAMHVLEVFTHSVLAMNECTSADVSIHMVLLHVACVCCHVCMLALMHRFGACLIACAVIQTALK